MNTAMTTSNKPSIKLFYASWYSPCSDALNFVENLSKDIDIQTIDVDAETDLAARYKIKTVPTLLVFQDGEIVYRSLKDIDVQAKEEIQNLLFSNPE